MSRSPVDAVADITADGTDARRLAGVIALLARPRCSSETVRSACRAVGGDGPPSQQLDEAIAQRGIVPGDEVTQLARTWRELGVRLSLVGDPTYPAALSDAWPQLDAPVVLAWRGVAPVDVACVAIVGTRRPSGYGTAVAAWLAEAVSAAGVRVVSGGAVGVDAAAHRASAEGPGGTTVVLGCGHAVDYPRQHARRGGLFDEIVAHGGTIVSELLPFEPPRAGRVRARNRIIAALAQAVVVVEGGHRSGALITAGAAAQWGRAVLAVPGDVRAAGSVAPHRLLSEGAAPCTGPGDLLDALGIDAGVLGSLTGSGNGAATHPAGSAQRAGEVFALLASSWPRPVGVEELAVRTDTPPARLLAVLTRARIDGLIVEGPDGVRLRQVPATKGSKHHSS